MKRARRAFTIMELLLAVSIFSIIAICLYTTFAGGIKIWRRQEGALQYSQGMRLALDAMTRELRNSINYNRPGSNQRGLQEMDAEDTDRYPVFAGTTDTVAFVTVMAGKIAKVTYLFDKGKEPPGVLKKRVALQQQGFTDDPKKEEVVVKNLSAVSFEYAYAPENEGDPLEWHDAWTDDKVPQGVRVTLTAQPEQEKKGTAGKETKKKEEIFRKTVFIPTGAQGKGKSQ